MYNMCDEVCYIYDMFVQRAVLYLPFDCPMRVMLADTGDSWWCVIIVGAVFGAAEPI